MHRFFYSPALLQQWCVQNQHQFHLHCNFANCNAVIFPYEIIHYCSNVRHNDMKRLSRPWRILNNLYPVLELLEPLIGLQLTHMWCAVFGSQITYLVCCTTASEWRSSVTDNILMPGGFAYLHVVTHRLQNVTLNYHRLFHNTNCILMHFFQFLFE